MIIPKRLNGITLSVRDLDRSTAWYREKFGFERLLDDAPNSDGVVIGAQGIELCLQEVDNPGQAHTVNHTRDVCVRLIAFEVEPGDLSRVEAEFAGDKGIIVLDDHSNYRSRIVEDPDGHCIELYANR